MNKGLVVGVVLVATLALTGCVTGIVPVKQLGTSSTNNVNNVVVGVQSNGTKHYVWQECSTESGCKLVYQRILLGATIIQFELAPPTTGESYESPDIAVTDDGQAFIVWRSGVTSGGSTTYTDYYAVVPSSVGSPPSRNTLASPAGASAGAPKVKARRNVVYAAYEISTGTSGSPPPTGLRYRQLSGGTSGGDIYNTTSEQSTNPSLAIDSNGKLHVAFYVRASSTPIRAIAYATNTSTTGNMPWSSVSPMVNTNLSAPDIDIGADNKPSIVYSYSNGSSDVVQINTIGGSAIDVPLTSAANPWRLNGNPHIKVLNTTPTIVFSASNSATANNEIWMYNPPASGPTRVTNNDLQEGEPLIAKENSTDGDIAVVAWRTYHTETLPPPIPLPLPCADNVYMFYFTPSALRQVSQGSGYCTLFGQAPQDLEANGPWVAGIWADRISNDNPRTVPWTTFNANTMYTPIVSR